MKTTLMIVLCSAAILASGCATSHNHATAWEYEVVQGQIGDASPGGLQAVINKAADDGWMVVSASSRPDAGSYGFVVMKRAKK
jgi:hypothetical protein